MKVTLAELHTAAAATGQVCIGMKVSAELPSQRSRFWITWIRGMTTGVPTRVIHLVGKRETFPVRSSLNLRS